MKFKNLNTAILLLLLPLTASAASREFGGAIESVADGKKLSFPLLKSEMTAKIKGDLATVTVKQTFINPSSKPMHATYLFPLNQDAAVQRMVMEIGDERVVAKIQRIEEAKATFETAKRSGKAASLLTEHRPNMFTQNIANLIPHKPVNVTLTYSHALPKIDGDYELVLPLIVGPRYQPQQSDIDPSGKGKVSSKTVFGQWEIEKLPAYPDVAGLNSPDIIDPDRVSIRVEMEAGMPITRVSSQTHTIKEEKLTDNERVIQLADGKTIDNKDFVLRYRLSGESAQAGLLAHKDERGGFFSIQLEPPALPAKEDIAAREMVFVLDTSGSMDGEPINASKRFMKYALEHLRANDSFRVIHFSNNAEEFTVQPVMASAENIRTGLQYVNSLTADGGTEIDSAIEQAFSKPALENHLRIVVFLTDGYIGNEADVLSHIAGAIGNARIYAFGVGTSVNRYLLDEMALRGRGFARYIDPTEKADDVAIALASKLESPVLTDIEIDWGELPVSDLAPRVIPDLFAGGAVRILGKYTQAGEYTIKLNGLVNGHKAVMPITINLPEENGENDNPIPVLWARSQIADTMRAINTPPDMRTENYSEDALKDKVTSLGLDYSLTTAWTAFVAVSEKIVNAHPEQAEQRNVPLPMVEGVTAKAYGESGEMLAASSTYSGTTFSGSATPEPSTIYGILVISVLGAGLFIQRRQRLNLPLN